MTQVQLTLDGQLFICKTDFTHRAIPKEAGFKWSDMRKRWFTPSASVAARLRVYADELALKKINQVLLIYTPWTSRIPFPEPRLTPYPWQVPAAKFALERNRSYLGLDPRLGKTIIAQLVINAEASNAVYICPPYLMASTKEKLSNWAMDGSRALIVPDSMLFKDSTLQSIKSYVEIAKLSNRKIRLFVDEAHRFKNMEAKRTNVLLNSIVPLFDKITFMSGTPMPNRPIELYPALSTLAPQTIDYKNYWEFGKKYCAGFRNQFGWDFSGASNMGELARKVIGPFMLRIRKEDVLKDLPPKLEEALIIDDTLPPTAARLDAELLKSFSPEDLMSHLAPNGHIATYRKELGIAKVPQSVAFINSLLEDTDENLLVFAHHKGVVSQLQEQINDAYKIVITGDTPREMKFKLAKEYQNNSKCRVFLGNIQAAGLGLDLFKADRVIFVEFSWVPGDNDQASERAYKVGKADNVFVQYVVYKNSVDRLVLDEIFKKRKNQKHI